MNKLSLSGRPVPSGSGRTLDTMRIIPEVSDKLTRLSESVVSLWGMVWGERPLSEADLVKLTPKEIHEHGLCNKARLHYDCHGRDNYRECG